MAALTLSPLDDRELALTAARAASAAPGVHALGTPASRRFADSVSAASGRETPSGVRVRSREDGVAVVVTIVAEYPRVVREVAEQVRRQVGAAVGAVVLGRLEVDVVVADVHGPFDPEEDEEEEEEEEVPAAEPTAVPVSASPFTDAEITEPVATSTVRIRPTAPVVAEPASGTAAAPGGTQLRP